MGRKRIQRTILPEELKDDTKERWKYYQKRYPSFSIEIENLKLYNKRTTGCFYYHDGVKNIKAYSKTRIQPNVIALSGEMVFNFSETKIFLLKNIGLSVETIDRLNSYNKEYTKNKNCVLMAVTGQLNNLKGKIYFNDNELHIAGKNTFSTKAYDRFDSFVFLLNSFYENINRLFSFEEAINFFSKSVFKEALVSENYNQLLSFLTSFKDVYDYCGVFYGIDKAFVDALIEHGKKPIQNEQDLITYLDFAERFWKRQEEIIEYLEKQNNKGIRF